MACSSIKDRVMDAIASIRDPEMPRTLEELEVVSEENIFVQKSPPGYNIKVVWKPTTPHCSFANNIGLSIIYKIQQDLSDLNIKLEILLKDGSHLNKLDSKAYVVDKQVNDKERVAAAFENYEILKMIKNVTDEIYQH
jgi:metal-sulfur cluster biosynthetic enzyme